MEAKKNVNTSATPEQTPPEPSEALENLVEQLIERKLTALRRESESRVAQAKGEGLAEGERLANMSADERRRYEQDRERERESELARRETELKRRELHALAADLFLERGLPKELAQFTDITDEAACERSVDALEKLFRESVQRAVEARLAAGHTLPRSSETPQTGIVRRMRAAAGLSEG